MSDYGFEIYDANGNITYSTSDVTWNYLGTYVAPENTSTSWSDVPLMDERIVVRQLVEPVWPDKESYVHQYNLAGSTLTATRVTATTTQRTMLIVFGR